MTESYILDWANMPKFSQTQTNKVIAIESLDPISNYLDEICNQFDQLSFLVNAKSKLCKYGLTDNVIDELSSPLSAYSINFQTQNINACIEGLSSIVERIWLAIKSAIQKLIEALHSNNLFLQLTNHSEFYRKKMADIISGNLKFYMKADLEKFNAIKIYGWYYNDFYKRTDAVGRLISKLKNSTSFNFDELEISNVFSDVIRDLSLICENNIISYTYPVFDRNKTSWDLEWNPFKVYQMANPLYSKVAVNAMALSNLQKSFDRILYIALAECDNVLSGRDDGNNELKVQRAKTRIRNIKNIQVLVHIAISNLCLLCGQWCRLANTFSV